MKTIKLTSTNNTISKDLTIGKDYKVIQLMKEYYQIKDDANDNHLVHLEDCELVEPIKWVMVRDDDNEQWMKRIFITDLGERFYERFVVVVGEYTDEYIEGDRDIEATPYRQMKPFSVEKLTIEEIQERLGYHIEIIQG